MIIRVVDFETTGLPPDAAICEVGWCDIETCRDHHTGDSLLLGLPVALLCHPGRLIPPEAMAVHHITNEDVANASPPDRALVKLSDDADIFAAHNASFEQSFFDGGGKPWICTWKVALRLAPRAPGHSNQVLRYWLNLDVDRSLASPGHRAGPDAYVTAALLARMLKKMSVDEMVAISVEPAILPFLAFGQHAKKSIEDVPSDYLEWCLRKRDMDVNVKHTAMHHLILRGKDPKENDQC